MCPVEPTDKQASKTRFANTAIHHLDQASGRERSCMVSNQERARFGDRVVSTRKIIIARAQVVLDDLNSVP